jgi:SOS-response transcriptional repressor LexA
MRMYVFSLLLSNAHMKTIDEIRRQNLAILVAGCSGVTQLAARAQKSASQISQWLNGSAHSGTGKARGMRSSSCRELERACGKEAGWMEVDHQERQYGGQDYDRNVMPAAMGRRAIPLISAIQAGAMKEILEPYAPTDGYATLYADDEYSKWAFALEIEGDSMLPEFRPGDLVIIDPEWEPRPGDYVAAKNGREEATFKKYRQRGVGSSGEVIFELVPLNEDYPTVRSDETTLAIIGVMAEHRRKTRRR